MRFMPYQNENVGFRIVSPLPSWVRMNEALGMQCALASVIICQMTIDDGGVS